MQMNRFLYRKYRETNAAKDAQSSCSQCRLFRSTAQLSAGDDFNPAGQKLNEQVGAHKTKHSPLVSRLPPHAFFELAFIGFILPQFFLVDCLLVPPPT